MEKMKVALADTFWTSFARLPKAQTKKVVEFVTKFRQSADSSGINYEKIKGACQSNYRSVRIDQAYRGIVLKPDSGRTYILLWVDHHDDAYAWAGRTKCEIHSETGVLQLYQTVQIESPETPAASDTVDAGEDHPQAVQATKPLFVLEQAQLLGIGVPETMFDAVLEVTSEKELEAMQARLPVEAEGLNLQRVS